MEERVVNIRPRTLLTSAGVLLALGAVVLILCVARHALTWVLISLFLALALNPAVAALQRRGLSTRGAAAATVALLALPAVAAATALRRQNTAGRAVALAEGAPGYV